MLYGSMSSLTLIAIRTKTGFSLNKFVFLVGYITGNLYFCTPVIKLI